MDTFPPQHFEVWAKVASYPAYSVSSHGRVRRDALTYGGGGSIRVPRGVLKQRALPLGHMQVTLSMNNKPITLLVHRLVAAAFLPVPGDGKDCVCHRDDNPSNNRPENLFWGTRLDNSNDKVQKNRQAKGTRINCAKLTPDLVLKIRNEARSGKYQRDIATEYGIAQSNVSLIVAGKTWSHVR